ncbi:MFS transporter [Xanthobacter sp. KR7-225]|uniref:MFS transporter n=1 Tax=Xanthobacter sp. KR7-225 TaxID=3156613 RepID=UPI0032B36768
MLAGAVGNLLEWYDFAIYGFFATAFAANFFPEASPTVGLISAFGVFAASFLMRPLGAAMFGHVADRRGRREALVISAAMMTVSTVAVGLLPTYEMAGLLAPLLLLLLRLFQGLAIGGEYMTSAVFLAENGPPRWRGTFASFATVGCTGGMLAGSAVGAATATLLTQDELLAFGWRLPFLLGIVLGGFALVLRRGLAETPPRTADTVRAPLEVAFRTQWRGIARASAMNFFLGVSFYLVFVYLSTWLQQVDDFPAALALELNTATMAGVLVLAVAFAALSDLVGRKWVVGAGFLGFALFSWPLFELLRSGDAALALLGQAGFAVLIATGGAMPATIAEMFPRHVRCTAVGISWNLAIGIGGGTAPMVAVMLVAATGDDMAPAVYLMAAAAVAFLALLGMPERHAAPLD